MCGRKGEEAWQDEMGNRKTEDKDGNYDIEAHTTYIMRPKRRRA